MRAESASNQAFQNAFNGYQGPRWSREPWSNVPRGVEAAIVMTSSIR